MPKMRLLAWTDSGWVRGPSAPTGPHANRQHPRMVRPSLSFSLCVITHHPTQLQRKVRDGRPKSFYRWNPHPSLSSRVSRKVSLARGLSKLRRKFFFVQHKLPDIRVPSCLPEYSLTCRRTCGHFPWRKTLPSIWKKVTRTGRGRGATLISPPPPPPPLSLSLLSCGGNPY